MTKQNNERAFQNFLKDLIKRDGSWVTQLHPGLGSDTGIPDLMTATDSIGLLPVEVKIGNLENEKILWSSVVRPSQIAWHTKITSHGWASSIIVGVPQGKTWRIFIVSGELASKCRDGWILGKEAVELDPRFFTSDIDKWAEETFSAPLEDL